MCGHPVPFNTVIITLAAHARVGEISEDGAKGAQPLDVEYHLVAGQGNDEEIHHEYLQIDAEFDIATDVGAGQTHHWPPSPRGQGGRGARGGDNMPLRWR
jgi:hypothetical protein